MKMINVNEKTRQALPGVEQARKLAAAAYAKRNSNPVLAAKGWDRANELMRNSHEAETLANDLEASA
ncbi:hypothetical protein KYT24_004384 [Salmonella enterica]|nr:hypothetical protein [Salmonella enterica]